MKDICNDKRILIRDITLVIMVRRSPRVSRSSKDRDSSAMDSFAIKISFRPR
jgi:hypothetical protein